MRVLASSTAGFGHFNPLVPLLEAFRRRGDDVIVVGPPSLASAVEDTGLPFRVGAEPPAEEQEAIWHRFATGSRQETAGLIDRELFGRLCTAAMLPAVESLFAEWPPDLVVREPCAYAAAVVAERQGVPHVQVAISQAQVEASATSTVAPVLAHYGDRLEAALRESPYLTRFPASLDPSPFPRTWRWRAVDEHPEGPLPDWWQGRSDPLVYVTFGSTTGRLPIAVPTFRAALEAVAGLPARVLLTIGRTLDAESLGPVPANVHVEAWIPQAGVLPEAAVVVCHGGSGTTFGALAAGVPLVVVPLFADQPANGRVVAAAGAGALVEPESPAGGEMSPLRQSDVPRLRSAIEAVLGEPSYSEAAKRIAGEMRALPTVDELVDLLARDVVGAPGRPI
jgi:UDP:flavonoid glycosyltransferase YjiC (YdhE family)